MVDTILNNLRSIVPFGGAWLPCRCCRTHFGSSFLPGYLPCSWLADDVLSFSKSYVNGIIMKVRFLLFYIRLLCIHDVAIIWKKNMYIILKLISIYIYTYVEFISLLRSWFCFVCKNSRFAGVLPQTSKPATFSRTTSKWIDPTGSRGVMPWCKREMGGSPKSYTWTSRLLHDCLINYVCLIWFQCFLNYR